MAPPFIYFPEGNLPLHLGVNPQSDTELLELALSDLQNFPMNDRGEAYVSAFIDPLDRMASATILGDVLEERSRERKEEQGMFADRY